MMTAKKTTARKTARKTTRKTVAKKTVQVRPKVEPTKACDVSTTVTKHGQVDGTTPIFDEVCAELGAPV